MGDPICVLVADDDATFAATLVAFLSALSREVKVVGRAANGQAALDLALSLQPDVVLMDIEMPVLDGIEATREIRRAGLGCVVIALSGSDYQERALEARYAGAVDYVRKSRLHEDLEPAIEAALQLDGASAA